MGLNIVFDINEKILKIETEIVRLKELGKKHYYDFDVIFPERNMGENLKTYFEGKGYVVELKWCKNCRNKTADIIIEILN